MSQDYDGESRWRHEARRLLSHFVTPKSIYMPVEAPWLLPAMVNYLVSRDLDYHLAHGQYGWYPAWYNGPRIIVPCIRTDSVGLFWQGRRIDSMPFAEDCKRWDSPHGPRGDALCYLRNPDVSKEGNFVIVEGPMDALAAAGCGYAAIALLGVSPPGAVLAHAATIIQQRRAICIADRDSVPKWIKIQNQLGLMGIHTKLVIPTEKDLAKLAREQRKTFLETHFGG